MLPLGKDRKLLTRKNLDVAFGTIMVNARESNTSSTCRVVLKIHKLS